MTSHHFSHASDGADARLLACIVSSSDDAIISKTVDGVITSWNGGAERMFGYSAGEMIGQPISLLAAPGREDEMPELLERLRRGERIDHFETVRRHKNGSNILVSLSVSPVHDADGRIIGASKVARDITGARHAADALKLAQERLQAQHRELMHAARLGELGQMAASRAHEINQPLSAIANYLQAAQRLLAKDDEASRERLEEAVRRATEQTLRSGEIIRRLRAFAKPNEGRLIAVSISELLREAAALAAGDAGWKGVTVELIPDADADTVLADPVEIQQMLLNLIRNAFEAMEDQPRRVLRLTTSASDATVQVAVADAGSGLPAELQARLFEPFITTKANGMGIGLSICRKIVDAHGGRFWADNDPAGGAIFRFTLRQPARA